MPLPNSFFLKLGAACFVLGGCMEAFMIKTGFYDVVLRNEADEWREGREEREGFAARVAQALQEKGVEVPEALRQQQQHQQQQQALQQRLQLAAKQQQQG